jgi:hypothetical protein
LSNILFLPGNVKYTCPRITNFQDPCFQGEIVGGRPRTGSGSVHMCVCTVYRLEFRLNQLSVPAYQVISVGNEKAAD